MLIYLVMFAGSVFYPEDGGTDFFETAVHICWTIQHHPDPEVLL
jgi:hypothetical protein